MYGILEFLCMVFWNFGLIPRRKQILLLSKLYGLSGLFLINRIVWV